MDMSAIISSVGTFVTAVGANATLSAVVILLIAASIGGLAFATIKRFARR